MSAGFGEVAMKPVGGRLLIVSDREVTVVLPSKLVTIRPTSILAARGYEREAVGFAPVEVSKAPSPSRSHL